MVELVDQVAVVHMLMVLVAQEHHLKVTMEETVLDQAPHLLMVLVVAEALAL
jgi:hypothetical protein